MPPDRPPAGAARESACSKILWRLTPVLFLSYVFCSMDRFNIAFAQLQLREALHFSDAAYGLGASLFFVTYVICEIPANLVLRRWGARRTFCSIMLGWGVCSAAMLFVRTPGQFYAGRLLLGALEAGYYPGVIYFLSTWLPLDRRSKAIAIFASGIVVAGVVVGPLSGWILSALDGHGGLAGWQWIFLLEGLPSCVMGLACFVFLCDRPGEAKWLTREELGALEAAHAQDRAVTRMKLGGETAGSLLREPKVYLFGLVFFCATSGIYALNFWVPTIIRSYGVDNVLRIGLYSVVPWGSAAIATVLIARHSDRTGERRWHFAATAFAGAAGLALSTIPHLPLVAALLLLSVGAVGVSATLPVFWTLPGAFIAPSLVAGGLAFVNSIGVTSGIVSPYVLGLLKQATGSLTPGLYFLAVVLCGGGLVLLAIVPAPARLARAAALADAPRAEPGAAVAERR
ncbi:MFS transporter [Burkholderia sp. WAC0059]|uniref:MFS transporter n=1 Tax=Burkholderia sp. WAC0059 TaxID=2066022 RepID=UPI000C7EA9A4|nr:MFS transporter [Burkholderia sp. WAC0059]PLZ00153.1 MFS transporter [Burkholderia sp. WAC0059]